MEVDIDRLSVDTEIPYKKKLNSSGSEIEVEFHPSESIVNQTKNAVFMYEGSNSISKDIEILSKYVRIRFLDKEKDRVLLDKQVERGKEYTINIMDNSIDNPDNFLLLDHNGMAIGFKIDDGEWGPDMDHKETFRRVLLEDTDIECEMLRFDAYMSRENSLINIVNNDKKIEDVCIGCPDSSIADGVGFLYTLSDNYDKSSGKSFKFFVNRAAKIFNGNRILIYDDNGGSYHNVITYIQPTIFKYCRNITHLASLIEKVEKVNNLILPSDLFKYCGENIKHIGYTNYEFNDDNKHIIMHNPNEYDVEDISRAYNIIGIESYGSLGSLNPSDAYQNLLNRVLESFFFSGFLKNVEFVVGGLIGGAFRSNVSTFSFKYTGTQKISPVNSVKFLSYPLTSILKYIDSSLIAQLFPNLETYVNFSSYDTRGFVLNGGYEFLLYLKNLKVFYRFFITNDLVNDETFSYNENLEYIGLLPIQKNFLNITDNFFEFNRKIKELTFETTQKDFSNEILRNNVDILFDSIAKNNLKITRLNYLFMSSINITYDYVQQQLNKLDKNTLTDVTRLFYYSDLTHLPELWDKSQYPNIVEHGQCFYNCTAADNYDQVPEGWK